MKFGEGKLLLWPLIFAAVFFFIPVTLFFAYPIGFWNSTDNEPHGLANALNLAYRLADLRMYPAPGMMGHPGVQFYLAGWLALALAGYPVAAAGQDFFRTAIGHVEDYHKAIVFIAALAGAAGVYIFARTALKLVPLGAVAVGLLLWLLSTPATILFFMSAGHESFPILINSLFLLVLVRLAFDRKIDPALVVLAGCVGAFAYLNKLSYVYVPLALGSAIFWRAAFCRIGWSRGAVLMAIFVAAFAVTIVATAYFVIGWGGFRDLLKFHRSVILGSGMYGAGDQVVVNQEGIRRAITSIAGERTYALPLALIAGAALFVAGVVTGLRDTQKSGVAVMSIGAGLAASFSALIVVKHYESHYTAGVSATLPACVVACWLFAPARSARLRMAAVASACGAVLLMAGPVLLKVTDVLASKSDATRSALQDIKEIDAETAGMKRVVNFAYRVPFPQYGEGFVVYYAGVPRMTQEHLQNRRGVTNSLTAHLVTEDIGAHVIDKRYFRDVEDVKSASNLNLLGPRPVTFNEGDRLIELRTVFLLIRK
ncbi:hypothetical protein [Bradyrhizobium sp.]|uniref:hypothetical protein n=1 Tax=Bradyrhizobium sp. TaxID=376 RepID=UPI0025C190F9|nr:hypothetical protein [Bradyrhizobium sp.]